jgi:hypothetical protein
VVRFGLAVAGVTDIGDFWLALNDEGAVLGTVGLYRYCKDVPGDGGSRNNQAAWSP